MIHLLTQQQEALRVEEARVFDFLHGLGAAFSHNIRPSDLHRLIVESAVRILDAHGGALYLADASLLTLIPAFISSGCPPLVEVPSHILKQAQTMPVALDSYLRLHSIAKGEGILGDVWNHQEPLFLPNVDEEPRLSGLTKHALGAASVMVSPLTYAGQPLGVLAVANRAMDHAFVPTDFDVFKAISEQSAFALYNAIIYSQANEKRAMDRDLEIARDIQRILLPANAPEVKGFEINGINIPARQVSGDYYDYIKVDDEHIGIAIADVAGKGVPASLIMAMCRSVLRSQAPNNPSPAAVLRAVNKQLYPDMKEDMFISMCYLVINFVTGEIRLARAGHDAPLKYDAKTHQATKINPAGMAVGIDSGSVFDRITNDFSLTLNQGDCIILYTDGVTEALDQAEVEYGLDKMISAIQASASKGSAAIVRRLTEDLRAFVGNHPQYDDITLLAIRRV